MKRPRSASLTTAVLATAVLAISAATSVCQAQAITESSSIEFGFSINAGPVDGYLQTPTGGKPGTSDIKRPALDELNIDNVAFYDLSLTVPWRQGSFYAGAQFISMTGDGVLKEDLVTRRPFKAGTPYDAKVGFNWYRVGGTWTIQTSANTAVAPYAEIALMDFDYDFDTPGDQVRRGYSKSALRVGVAGAYAWSERLDLRGDIGTSIPISKAPVITTAKALVRFGVYEGETIDTGYLFAGLGLLTIDYEDDQTLPNHIRLEVTPHVTVGLAVAFGGK